MAGRGRTSAETQLPRLCGLRSLKADALVGKDIAVSECPRKRDSGSRGGHWTYENPPRFVENRANRRVRPRRDERNRTTAAIGRADGNPSGTVIAADGGRCATIAGPRADRRGCP